MFHLYVETKKYNKLVNITKKNQAHKYETELVVTSGERGWGRGKVGVGD